MKFRNALFLACALLVGGQISAQSTYYVDAVHGSDEYPGAESAPFRSLDRALRQYRVLKETKLLSKEGFRIVLASGTYSFRKGIRLTQDDSAPFGHPLVIEGRGDVVLSGGVELSRSAFAPVTDQKILNRLPEASRGSVRVYDLAKLGVKACDEFPVYFRGSMPCGELYVNGQRQNIARWPNEGWATIKKAIERGSMPSGDNKGQNGVFEYESGEPLGKWSLSKGVWLHGYWCHDWYDEYIRIASVDEASRKVELTSSQSPYGIGTAPKMPNVPRRYEALNVLEELDREGEWCIEPGTTLLYAWLPAAQENEQIVYSVLQEPFFALNKCDYVEFVNLAFECSRGNGLQGFCSGVSILGCEFRHIAKSAVCLNGSANQVIGCDIFDIGACGVMLEGGNMKTLERGECRVENCHIWLTGQHQRTYAPAVHLSGVGNFASHNVLHDLPHSAIIYNGCEQLIDCNEIYRTCQETADAGALYTGRHWESQGNIIRYNYIHHNGGVNGWSMGVYLDDCDSGDTVEGNVFEDVRRAVFIGGGRENNVRGNVFIGCSPSVFMDDRGPARIHFNTGKNDTWDLEYRLKALNYRQPPWSVRYPRLAQIMEDNPCLPLYNTIQGNIVIGGTGISMKEDLRKLVAIEGNAFLENPADQQAAEIVEALHDKHGFHKALQQVIPDFAEIPLDAIGLVKDGIRRKGAK